MMLRSENYQYAQLLGAQVLGVAAACAAGALFGSYLTYLLAVSLAALGVLSWRRRATDASLSIRIGFMTFVAVLALLALRNLAG